MFVVEIWVFVYFMDCFCYWGVVWFMVDININVGFFKYMKDDIDSRGFVCVVQFFNGDDFGFGECGGGRV